jgi:hypothetical protein
VRVNRTELLTALEAVSPGLATKESVEQGSCFVFRKGKICTFNEEIACESKSPLGDFEGAVTAKPLWDLISKLQEDELEIEIRDGVEFRVVGKGKRSGIRMEAKVMLPIDTVEQATEWKPLDKDFAEAVGIVASCASREQSEFILTCIHVHPEYLEACDRFQIGRYPVQVPVKGETLVRAESLAKIVPLSVTEISESPGWLHFRNEKGLTFSCRRFLEKYHDIGEFTKKKEGFKIALPGGLEDMVSKGEIFSGENAAVGNHMIVTINPDFMEIRGEGASGWYAERRPIEYQGAPIKFLIGPKILVAISKKAKECVVESGFLLIDTGRFIYSACTNPPEPQGEKKEEGK